MTTRLPHSSRSVFWLASAVLIAGFGLPASVQAQSFQCQNSSGVPPTVRAEGYTEYLGDLVLDCTGGIPTPPNQPVQQVNITVNLDTYVSSKVTAVSNQVQFLESLVIVDEPNSSRNPTRPLLNCGHDGAPDNTAAGPGVCQILGGGANGAHNSYDGTPGHPNVFQGRSLALINGQTNQILFLSLPVDPPGTICPDPYEYGQPAACHRIIRITNIRGDATTTGVATANQVSTVTATLVVNPVSGLPIDNPSHIVARVQLGLVQSSSPNSFVSFREAFANAFKPKNLAGVCANGGLGFFPSINNYNGGTAHPPDAAQNIPGFTYDAESGFEYQNDSILISPTNPFVCSTVSSVGNPFSSTGFGGLNTGISEAGVADAGTRLALRFTDIPAGASVQVPQVVQLINVINHSPITGVMVLTGTDAAGAGPYSPISGILTPANNTAVYEILFANPGALEEVNVPVTLLNAPPDTMLHVATGYAPFYLPNLAVRTASATLPVPRFIDSADAFCLLGPCINMSPSKGANSGPINVAIFGNPILGNAQVKLSRPGFPDIPGTATSYVGQSFLTTTFDLTGAPLGPRDLVVTPQTGLPVTNPALFYVNPPTACSYEVGGPFFENNFFRPLVFPASGGSGDLVVTPRPSTCSWQSSSSVPWITLPPKSNSVTQPYIVDANPGPDARGGFGVITVAGQNIYVFQHGVCTVAISPGSKIFDAGGGTIAVNVTAPADCSWTAVSSASWLTISAGASGSGNGSVTLQAAPNAGGPRSATVTMSNPFAEPKTFSGSQGPSTCGAIDVSPQVSVVRGAFLSNFLGSAYTQQVRLTNQGAAIPGPVYLAVDGLVAGSVAPTNRTSSCQPSGVSYLILAAPNGLSAGQLVNLTLTFQPGIAAKGAPPSWTTTRVLSGTPSQ